MNPTIKAKQLVEKFYQLAPETFGTGKSVEYGQKCALVCVDEILLNLESERIILGSIFWKQVKSEIEKL